MSNTEQNMEISAGVATIAKPILHGDKNAKHVCRDCDTLKHGRSGLAAIRDPEDRCI